MTFGPFGYLLTWAFTPSDDLILTILLGVPLYQILVRLEIMLWVIFIILPFFSFPLQEEKSE